MPISTPSTSPIIVDGRMMFQPQCFGIARVIIEMVKRFPTNSTRPVKMIVPAVERSSHLVIDQIPASVERITCNAPISSPHRISELHKILRRENAGVFFAPYHALAPLRVPCPMVVDIHDCILEADVRLSPGRPKQLAYIANTARVLRQAAAAIAPSDATAAAIGGFYSRVPPMTVCKNGVDLGDFADADEQSVAKARQQLGLPAKFILNVGSRRPHKNQAMLVRALAKLDPTVSLVLVGRPDPRIADDVPALIKELGLESRVVMLDSVPDDLLVPTYRAASVFAFPSAAEGFGLPPLEAMAAGVPVVASSIPVVAEVCRDGSALLVSPYDDQGWATALDRVISSPALATELVEKGKTVAAASGWDTGAARLFALLDSVAAGTNITRSSAVHAGVA